MRERDRRFEGWDIYVVSDRGQAGGMSHADIARCVFEAGGRVFQLRDKSDATDDDLLADAREIARMSREGGVAFIVNDRVSLAAKCGATGVHLGRDDMPVREARRLLGTEALIGYSTHHPAQVEEALALASDPAARVDYISYGPLFPTRSKEKPDPIADLDALRKMLPRIRLPVVGVGGIYEGNLPDVIQKGVEIVAVIGAAMAASPLEIVQNVRSLRKKYFFFLSGRVTA